MQLSAVLLARVAFFVESVDLNPRGQAFYPAVIRGLVEHYQFQSFPQKLEDYDEQKGVTLAVGRSGDRTIDKVVIYSWGLTIDTTSSTSDAEQLLDEALRWSAANLRLTYDRAMIKRKAYLSQVTFYSDAALLPLNPLFDGIAKTVSDTVTSNLKLPYRFRPVGILLGADPEEQVIPVQRFSIERRERIAFSENKYFSSAPIPTELHLRLLDEYEKAMRDQPLTATAQQASSR
jgi:hypothetical protein